MKTYGLASENSSEKPKNFRIHNQSSSTTLASKSLKNEIIAAKRMQKLIKKLLNHLWINKRHFWIWHKIQIQPNKNWHLLFRNAQQNTMSQIFCWMRKWSINPYLPYFYVYYASYAFPHDITWMCLYHSPTTRVPISTKQRKIPPENDQI